MVSLVTHFSPHLDGISVHFLVLPVISGQTAQSVILRFWTHPLFTFMSAPLGLDSGS